MNSAGSFRDVLWQSLKQNYETAPKFPDFFRSGHMCFPENYGDISGIILSCFILQFSCSKSSVRQFSFEASLG